DTQRRGQRPHGVELQHDVHRVADALADLPQRLEPRAQLGRGDLLTVGLFRDGVEGPDLHRGHALFEQALGQRSGVGEEGLQVLVRARRLGLVQAPVVAADAGTGATGVAVTGARVVD